MKQRLFSQRGVAARRNSYSYSSSLRLALQKNPSVSFVPKSLGGRTNQPALRSLSRVNVLPRSFCLSDSERVAPSAAAEAALSHGGVLLRGKL